MSVSQAAPMLRVMPREMRVMTERVLSLTALPKGFVLTAADLVMYSQKLGLGGFTLLEARFGHIEKADATRIAILEETGECLRLDAGGQHAWVVIPSIIDLLGELSHRFGAAAIAVSNVVDTAELEVATALAARSGLSVSFDSGGIPRLTAVPMQVAGDVRVDEPLLWDLLQNGAAIEAELWWRIYHLAQKALTPDSIVSRRHAGPLIVNDDGTVIGRKDNDDETDLTFLTSVIARDGQKESTES
jgi:hypothetical protein